MDHLPSIHRGSEGHTKTSHWRAVRPRAGVWVQQRGGWGSPVSLLMTSQTHQAHHLSVGPFCAHVQWGLPWVSVRGAMTPAFWIGAGGQHSSVASNWAHGRQSKYSVTVQSMPLTPAPLPWTSSISALPVRFPCSIKGLNNFWLGKQEIFLIQDTCWKLVS